MYVPNTILKILPTTNNTGSSEFIINVEQSHHLSSYILHRSIDRSSVIDNTRMMDDSDICDK